MQRGDLLLINFDSDKDSAATSPLIYYRETIITIDLPTPHTAHTPELPTPPNTGTRTQPLLAMSYPSRID